MKERNTTRQYWHRFVCTFFAAVLVFSVIPVSAYSNSGKHIVPGKVYLSGKDGGYEYGDGIEYAESGEKNTYGVFYFEGDATDSGMTGGVPAYKVSSNILKLHYDYSDVILNADIDSWHLIEDKSKKLNDITLPENILKGAIVIETSKDRVNWITAKSTQNVFATTPSQTAHIYEANEVQLSNGCYYRIIVAYELRIRTEDSNFLFVNTDKYDYKKVVEVYEFYAYTENGNAGTYDPDNTYRLGNRVRAANFEGYSGEAEIKENDVHRGWDIGHFFVSGYTDSIAEKDGNVVFLKNAGDKVTLWFRLEEDINALQGKDSLSITADPEGSDDYFETSRMDFGRGALIIRHTDRNNMKTEPQIYVNYLEANASVDADTIVRLFEEGDYEVALDYQITDDRIIDDVSHYRIFFTFSVRNSNCMVYLFDLGNNRELSTSSITETGFRIDFAGSKYLRVTIKREVMKDSADGLVEDTRFNGAAKDGSEYRNEGIYTITAYNEYTNTTTEKKIYVGTNNVMKAHMATGKSIPEINALLEQGATITDDGLIEMPAPTVTTQPETTPEETQGSQDNTAETSVDVTQPVTEVALVTDTNQIPEETEPTMNIPVICSALAAIVAFAIWIIRKRLAKKVQKTEDGGDAT